MRGSHPANRKHDRSWAEGGAKRSPTTVGDTYTIAIQRAIRHCGIIRAHDVDGSGRIAAQPLENIQVAALVVDRHVTRLLELTLDCGLVKG